MTATTTARQAAQEIAYQRSLRQRLPPPEERRSLRVSNDLSQADLARAMHTTRQAVSKYEAGRTPHGELLELYVGILEELARESA